MNKKLTASVMSLYGECAQKDGMYPPYQIHIS